MGDVLKGGVLSHSSLGRSAVVHTALLLHVVHTVLPLVGQNKARISLVPLHLRLWAFGWFPGFGHETAMNIYLYTSFCSDTCFHFSWSASLFWNTLSLPIMTSFSDFVSICFLLCFLISLFSLQTLCAKGYHIPILGLLSHLSSSWILALIISCMQLTQICISSLEFLNTELYI